MSTKAPCLLLAILLASLASAQAAADVLYENTASRGSITRFAQSGLEYGEEIVLVGNGTYVIDSFAYEFFNEDPSGTNVLVTLRLYANDGLNGTPGTKLFESDAYGIPNTAADGYVICYRDLNVPLSSRSFTWTVQFTSFGGIAPAGLLETGLDMYSTPTVGSTYDDYWERNASGNWELRVGTNTSLNLSFPINFGCRVLGTYAGPAAINGQPVSTTGLPGRSATFSVSAIGTEPLSYQWKKAGTPIPGATASTLTLNNVTFADAGSYSVTVANAQGSTSSVPATLTVHYPLLYDNSTQRADPERFATSGTEFGEEIILAGNGTTYTVTNFLYEYYGYGPDLAAGLVAARLRFYANDGPLGVPSTLLFDSGPSDPLPATGDAGYVINYAELNVIVPRNFTWTVEFLGVTTPNNLGLLQAGLDLYSTPTVGQSYDDYWERDSLGAWHLRLGTNVLLGMSVPINFGCQVAGTYAGPPSFTLHPRDTHAFVGQTATLSSYALGSSPLTYQWRKNGNPIAGATANFLSLPNVTLSDAGTYTVVANNTDGTATSQSAVLTIETNTPPTITLTSPANGATFNSGIDLGITASATDPDATYGAVSYVEFIINGVRLSVDSNAPYQFTWTNVPVGTHVITAIATDNAGGTGSATPVTITVGFDPSGTNTLVNQGSSWLYRDSGVDPGATWPTTGYDDSSWTAGLAPFGYGDGDEATVVNYGSDLNNRPITTWFRRAWQVDDPTAFAALEFKLLRDDGAVVYLNGVELVRQNMPAGTITASTLASSDVTGTDAGAFFSTIVGKQGLVSGQNLLAVEIHQASASSPDLSFDLQLIALGGQAPLLVGCTNRSANTAPGQCTATVTFPTPIVYDNKDTLVATCLPPSGSAFAKGVQTVICSATDLDGNPGSCSFTVTVTDTEPPVVHCPANRSVGTSTDSCSSNVTFTATASDNCTVSTFVCVPASGQPFALGPTTVTCTATDNSGNSDTCSFTITVVDTQAPTLTCPANVMATAAPGTCSSTVTYALATVTDNCSSGLTVTCNPASGSTFNVGTHTVICSATDAAGRTGTCSFSVIVQDTQAPVLTCPANIIVSTPGNSCASNVLYSVSVSDNCSGAAVTCTPPSGSPFPGGTNTVTCTGTDISGNSATPCSFQIVVIDNQPPTINCPANITIATVPGYTTNVSWTVTATDNCPTIHTACIPESGSSFANGTTTPVTCTVSDDGGGTATCSFTVTVTDLGPACVTEVLYGFNELIGTSAVDSSGSGNTGTLLNGPIRTAGPVTEALQFDGVNDYVVCNNTTALDITGTITLGCWLRPVNTMDSRYLMVKGRDASLGWSYRLAVVKGKVQYSWVSPSGTINTFATTKNVLSAGKWIHFAVSHQPGTSPTFYINGVVEPSGLAAGSATALRRTSSYGFAVGAASDGVAPFNGAIDEPFVCSSLLNDLQRWSLTNGISPCARPPLTISTVSPLTSATVGASYSVILAATGGSQPYSWALASGTLPTGLTLSGAGLLAGTPSVNGTFTFRVRVTDGVAATTEKDFSLLVNAPPPPVITSVDPLPSGMIGKPYGISLSANGASPFTWSIPSGTLPPGLSLAPSTGIISGTPTAAATNTFTARVTDSWSQSGTKVFTLPIESAPNYAVYYRFEEGNGTNAIDSSGNANTGTLVNGPTRMTSPTGGAIRFDGLNDRVSANSSASLNHTGSLTLAAWVFPETVADLRTIMIKGDGKATTSYTWMFRQSAAKLQYRWVTGSKTENRYETVGNILAIGRWTHVAVVHVPGSSTPPQFYSNGVAVAGTLTAGSYANRFGTISSQFTVGSGANGTQPYYGVIDEAMFVRAALSSNGVANLMQMALPVAIMPAAAEGVAPIQLTIEQSPGAFLLRWNTQPGRTYRVQHRLPQAGETSWLNLSDWLTAERETMTYRDATEDRFFRWYRVVSGE